ncbi:hypothetical protein [Streptomyces sp. R41]|uniref:DUF317 domain-containing protein n=1 Tax=Streptomyces sp. R41 TaxID=3238632 RepID=A0AB39RTG5_9ACTN
MNGIEFFHYPSDEHPSSHLWGLRVDGTDLRAHAAWATRERWRPELEDQFEDQERESAELIWRQHDGLGVVDFEDRPDHFLSPAAVPLLGCSCGIWGCWPLMARIAVAPTTVTWSSFRQPHRAQWGELPIGLFVFERKAYEEALRSPAVLTEDPLGPPPARLGVV